MSAVSVRPTALSPGAYSLPRPAIFVRWPTLYATVRAVEILSTFLSIAVLGSALSLLDLREVGYAIALIGVSIACETALARPRVVVVVRNESEVSDALAATSIRRRLLGWVKGA